MRSTVRRLYTVSASSGRKRQAYRLLLPPAPHGFLCGGDGGGDLRIHDELPERDGLGL